MLSNVGINIKSSTRRMKFDAQKGRNNSVADKVANKVAKKQWIEVLQYGVSSCWGDKLYRKLIAQIADLSCLFCARRYNINIYANTIMHIWKDSGEHDRRIW